MSFNDIFFMQFKGKKRIILKVLLKGGLNINSEVNDLINKKMPDVFLKHPDLFSKKDLFVDYLEQKEYLKEQNEIVLNEIAKDLVPHFGNSYNKKELFYMQKLYLLYPNKEEIDLLDLSWEHIKIILNIFDKNKRLFYINICLKKNLDVKKLKNYLLMDLYEKYFFVKEKYQQQDFSLDKLIELANFIWND